MQALIPVDVIIETYSNLYCSHAEGIYSAVALIGSSKNAFGYDPFRDTRTIASPSEMPLIGHRHQMTPVWARKAQGPLRL
ncbi:C6 transcription factor [Aspergillus luchuensis]|uniref:C6 transcription factor n=1 Tax=Aspergillus kawachii TaxID=1069201 RepID=A0A146FI82_ASPKA|nr:C6 transcription factor [Aspergillus luchuensis]